MRRLAVRVLRAVQRALVSLLTRRHASEPSRERPIVLAGGHGGRFCTDNSRSLASWLLGNRDAEIYWVYRRPEARAAARSAGFRPIRMGGPRSLALSVSADLIIMSHGMTDILPRGLQLPQYRRTVMLNHGYWGMKQIDRRNSQKHLGARVSHVIATRTEEVELKAKVYGVDKERVIVTGLPRHEGLLGERSDASIEPSEPSKPSKPSKQHTTSAFVFPTWRDWLRLNFQRPLDMYVSDIIRVLSAAPTEVSFITYVAHPNLSREVLQRIQASVDERVVIRPFSNDTVLLALRDSDMFLTDYSSIIYDAVLMQKRCALVQQDGPVYRQLIGTYPHADEELAPLTFTEPEAAWDFVSGSDRSHRAVAELRQRLLSEIPESPCREIARLVLPLA